MAAVRFAEFSGGERRMIEQVATARGGPGRTWLGAGLVAAGLGAMAFLGGNGVAAAERSDQPGPESGTHRAGPAKPAASSQARRAARAVPRPSGSPHAARLPDVRETKSTPEPRITVPAKSAFPPGPIQSAILGMQAYIYGYPLLEFENFRSQAPALNTLWSLTEFAEPSVMPIFRPNTDTLYSRAVLDLSAGPVVLSVPDMGDRYFSFQLNDPYTNVVDYLGTRATGSGPGTYAITWDGGPAVAVEGATTVIVPFRNMMLLGRTLAGDLADQQRAVALMNDYRLTATGVTASPPPFFAAPTGLAALDAISKAMEINPPPIADSAQLQAIAQIGVGPGLRVADAALAPLSQAAADLGARLAAALLPRLSSLNQYFTALLNEGWAAPPAAIGDYGIDYQLRAGVFYVGPWANTVDEAMYSAGLLDQTLQPLSGRNTYLMHFAPGLEPPAAAFWSVTVYDGAGYLVPNSADRYSVSNSRPEELVRRPDGSIDIIFASQDPGDPDANWLPIPDDIFSAYLRIYLPKQAALEGSWRPPPILRRS